MKASMISATLAAAFVGCAGSQAPANTAVPAIEKNDQGAVSAQPADKDAAAKPGKSAGCGASGGCGAPKTGPNASCGKANCGATADGRPPGDGKPDATVETPPQQPRYVPHPGENLTGTMTPADAAAIDKAAAAKKDAQRKAAAAAAAKAAAAPSKPAGTGKPEGGGKCGKGTCSGQ